MLDTSTNFASFIASTDNSSLLVYSLTFIVLLINGFLNFPSSQVYYLALGYYSISNDFNIGIAIMSGAIGNTLGNYILYTIISSNNAKLRSRIINFLNVDDSKISSLAIRVKNGWLYLIPAKLIPSVKILVPIVAGLSDLSARRALFIFSTGSLIWASILTFIGVHFGKSLNLSSAFIVLTVIYISIGFYFRNSKLASN